MTAVPPFRALDPALRTAEALLAEGRLDPVVRALPDEHAAARALNALIGDARLRLRHEDGRWRAALTNDLGDLAGLVALVVADGWRRLKRCEVCATPFVDRTNGCSRRRCAGHRRRPVTGSGAGSTRRSSPRSSHRPRW